MAAQSGRPHKQYLPRLLPEMVESLRRHTSVLEDFCRKAFDDGDLRYCGEVAAKLRLMFCTGGRNHRPLVMDLMTEFGHHKQIVSLTKWLGELAQLVQTPFGQREFSNEQFIRTWAEQAGAAHEDWAWTPGFRAEQEGLFSISGMPPNVMALMKIARSLLRIAQGFLDSLSKERIQEVNRKYALRVLNPQFIEQNPEVAVDSKYLRSLYLFELDQLADAIVEVRQAISLVPEQGRFWELLGQCQQFSGDLSGAISSYEHAFERRWHRARVAYNIACCYARLEACDEAVTRLEWIAKLQWLPQVDPFADEDLRPLASHKELGGKFLQLCTQINATVVKSAMPDAIPNPIFEMKRVDENGTPMVIGLGLVSLPPTLDPPESLESGMVAK